MKEVWKPVTYKPFDKSHLVSNLGRVKSINKILKPNTNNKGYHRYGLYTPEKMQWFSVSRLVLCAFIGQPPLGNSHAMHLDDNKDNNRLDNLKWGSAQDNQDLKVLHSRQARGENNGRSKLKKEQVLLMRKLYTEGSYNQSELGRAFGITHGHAWAILRNENWKE